MNHAVNNVEKRLKLISVLLPLCSLLNTTPINLGKALENTTKLEIAHNFLNDNLIYDNNNVRLFKKSISRTPANEIPIRIWKQSMIEGLNSQRVDFNGTVDEFYKEKKNYTLHYPLNPVVIEVCSDSPMHYNYYPFELLKVPEDYFRPMLQ